jgi:hypothetical protein
MIDRLQSGIRRVSGALIEMLRADATDYRPRCATGTGSRGWGLYGLMRAYEATGEPSYLEYCKLYVDRLLAEDQVSYSINGAVVFETVLKLYEHLGDERYRVEMRYFLRWLLHSASRCQDGCFEHSWIEPDVHLVEQVWIDTLFMAGIVLADSAGCLAGGLSRRGLRPVRAPPGLSARPATASTATSTTASRKVTWPGRSGGGATAGWRPAWSTC